MMKKLFFFLLLLFPILGQSQAAMDFQKMGFFITAISQPTENKVVAIGGSNVIYYSEDGGNTWHGGRSPVTISTNLTDISMGSANIGWVVGSGGVILKTIDGGVNWAQQGIGLTTLSIDAVWAVNDTLVYACGGGGASGVANACFILKSINGGSTWTSILPSGTPGISGNNSTNTLTYWTSLKSLYFFDANVGYAAGGLSSATLANGSGGKILKTTDGGATWNITTIASTNFSFRSITFANDTIGYACGNPMNSTTPNNFWKTTDGGTTWVLFNAYNLFLQKVRAASTDRVYVATGAGSVAVVRHTYDGGVIWKNDTLSTTTGTFTGLSIRDTVVYAGGGLALIHKYNSNAAGTGWVQKHVGISGNPNDLFFIDSNNGWAAVDGGKVAKTTNGGATWNFVAGAAGTGFSNSAVFFTNLNTGYVVGASTASATGSAIKTTDGGNTWVISPLPAGTSSLWDTYFTDSNTGWAVGSAGTILKTEDGGASWAAKPSGITTVLNGVFFVNANTGWAVGFSGKILKTVDGGNTWVAQALPGTLTTTLYDVWFANLNEGYISGASGKVFKTVDGGATWVDKPTGFTIGNIQSMEWFDTRRGIIAVSGSSIWSTHNGGDTWAKLSPYLTTAAILSLEKAPNASNPDNIYFGHGSFVGSTANFTIVKTSLTRYYGDEDGDGYASSSPTDLLIAPPTGYTTTQGTDCVDNNPNINPGATEVCNTVDDDCDGTADDGATTTFYADTDADTYGDPANAQQACSAASGFVTDNTDCNDNDANINPAATEVCFDAIDQNCDGQPSEGCPPLAFNYTLTHSCISAIGNSITVNSVLGGVMPFSYSKNGGTTYQTGATFNGLAAGTYNIMVKDATNTTASQTVTVGGLMTLSASSTSPLCNAGSDGSVSVNVTGGYPAYSFAWTKNNAPFGGNTASLPNVGAGSYKVVVTDDKGCTKVATKSVTQPAAISVKGVKTLITCRDANNGAIDLIVSGGTPNYTYLWNDGATTQDRTGLAPGTYSCIVTDINGCTKTSLAFAFSNPAALTVNISKNNIACFGETNGSAIANGVGGTGAKSYLWSNNATTNTISNLAAGTYSVVVTDSKGCTVSGSTTIIEPTQLQITSIISSPSGTNYTVVVSATGGTTPRKFRRTLPDGTWTLPNTTGVFSAVSAGTYTFEVKDVKNCVTTQIQSIPVVAKPNQAVSRTETPNNLEMFVAPNPAKDQLQVRLGNAETKGRVIIFSSLGKMVLEQEVNLPVGESLLLDLAKIETGGYTIQFLAADGSHTEKRFVVVK